MSELTVQDVISIVGRNTIKELFNQTGNRYLGDAVEKYIQEKLSVANYLGLHKTSGKTLIDIGTGAGWFPYICRLYGHDCIGTETIHTDIFKKTYVPIYEYLNLKVTDDLVFSNKPFTLSNKVDYIVTLRSFFNNRPTVWEINEWKYFFKDILKNLNPNGGLYLSCNNGRRNQYKNVPVSESSHWGSVDVGEMFKPYVIPADKQKKIKANTLYIPYSDVVKLGETQ